MNKITIEDVNKLILGTDIKILDSTTVTDFSLKLNSLYCYGVYVLNYKHNESYIGMTDKGYIKSRLLTYLREAHHKKLINSIDIFVTNSHHAHRLEQILIQKCNPELNTTKYKHNMTVNDEFIIDEYNETSFNDEYNFRYGNDYKNSKFIKWLKQQSNRSDIVGDISRELKSGVDIENIKNYALDSLYKAYAEYKYIHMNKDILYYFSQYSLFLINSVNPHLNSQLNYDRSFYYNYKIVYTKYDEVVAIQYKNLCNTWEERDYYDKSNDKLRTAFKISEDEWKKTQNNIYEKCRIKEYVIEKNYFKLILEINDEVNKLFEKYNKNRNYLLESYYDSCIQEDVDYIKYKNNSNTKTEKEEIEIMEKYKSYHKLIPIPVYKH